MSEMQVRRESRNFIEVGIISFSSIPGNFIIQEFSKKCSCALLTRREPFNRPYRMISCNCDRNSLPVNALKMKFSPLRDKGRKFIHKFRQEPCYFRPESIGCIFFLLG